MYLFIRQDAETDALKFLLLKDEPELLFGDFKAVAIGGVDHVDDGAGVGVVGTPVGPDRGLSAQIPDLEFEVLVLHGLDVEADCY